MYLVRGGAQGEKLAAARARLLPLLPVVQPHPPPDPLRQSLDDRVGATKLVVVEPAEDIPAQFVDDVLHGVAPVASGDLIRSAHPSRGHPPGALSCALPVFPHALLEAVHRLARPHQPTLAVHGIAEEFAETQDA